MDGYGRLQCIEIHSLNALKLRNTGFFLILYETIGYEGKKVTPAKNFGAYVFGKGEKYAEKQWKRLRSGGAEQASQFFIARMKDS